MTDLLTILFDLGQDMYSVCFFVPCRLYINFAMICPRGVLEAGTQGFSKFESNLLCHSLSATGPRPSFFCISFSSPITSETHTHGARYEALFLASTVSALHRNAHIEDASHTLSVTYYNETLCTHLVWRPKKEFTKNTVHNLESNQSPSSHKSTFLPTELWEQLYSMGWSFFYAETPINSNFKSHLFVEKWKIQSMPKIMNHLFRYCLNCVGNLILFSSFNNCPSLFCWLLLCNDFTFWFGLGELTQSLFPIYVNS